MTDETKKLFDAPFAVMGDSTDYTKFNVIIHSRKSPRYCSTVASCIDQKTAIRFARLPELYDALNKQTYYRCVDCLRHTAKTIDDIPLNNDMIEHGCPKNRTDCGAFDVWELLRKVRDGE